MIKPIIFNTHMVQAILSGRKTVTRRIIKPQPKMRLSYISGGHGHGKWNYPAPDVCEYWGDEWRIPEGIELTDADRNRLWTPPCHTDDILYVRETWAHLYPDETSDTPCGYLYKADREGIYGDEYKRRYDAKYPGGEDYTWKGIWKPSIHMPKEAARLFLKVTNVSVDRLQNMSMQDSLAEGVKLSLAGMVSANEQEIEAVHGSDSISLCGITESGKKAAMKPFIDTWEQTIPKKDIALYGWDANPYVWVIEFKRISQEETI